MTTTEFRESREEMLDRHERRACLFVVSCGAVLTLAWTGLLVAWLS